MSENLRKQFLDNTRMLVLKEFTSDGEIPGLTIRADCVIKIAELKKLTKDIDTLIKEHIVRERTHYDSPGSNTDFFNLEKELNKNKPAAEIRPAATKAISFDKIEGARDYIANKIVESFADELGQAWALVRDADINRLMLVESETFGDWIRTRLNSYGGQPRENWVQPLTGLFAAIARRGETRKLHLRQTSMNGDWYYQLDCTSMLALTDELKLIPIKPWFRHFTHQEDISVDLNATPEDLSLLDKYTNFADENERELFKTILPVYFVPGIAKPMQLFRGDPGSAKSTLCRILKKLIDPSLTMGEGTKLPAQEDDWFVNSTRHAVMFFDNLSFISKEQQDDCCRAVTGMNIEKRKLYTNFEAVSGYVKAIICINAIDLSGLNSDFVDRALIWNLRRIKEEERVEESKFWHDFEQDVPKIRGAIFKILLGARKAKITRSPRLRLTDFSRWAAACAISRGHDPDSFAAQISVKVELQRDESLGQSPVAGAIYRFMDGRDKFDGLMRVLLELLTEQEYGKQVGNDIIVKHVPRDWPSAAHSLGRELSRVAYLLEQVGVKVEKKRGKEGVTVVLTKKQMCQTPRPPGVAGVAGCSLQNESYTNITQENQQDTGYCENGVACSYFPKLSSIPQSSTISSNYKLLPKNLHKLHQLHLEPIPQENSVYSDVANASVATPATPKRVMSDTNNDVDSHCAPRKKHDVNELINFLQTTPNNALELYKQFDEQFIQDCVRNGIIAESPPGRFWPVY